VKIKGVIDNLCNKQKKSIILPHYKPSVDSLSPCYWFVKYCVIKDVVQ